MDTRFLPHNTHLEKPDAFIKQDPHLNQLSKQTLVHRSQLLDQIPRYISGIYTLSGGRQTGKTTRLKQWMTELLESRVPPNAIAYVDKNQIWPVEVKWSTQLRPKQLKQIT